MKYLLHSYQFKRVTLFVSYYHCNRQINRSKNVSIESILYILVTKITAVQNEVARSYHIVRGLYLLADIFRYYSVQKIFLPIETYSSS